MNNFTSNGKQARKTDFYFDAVNHKTYHILTNLEKRQKMSDNNTINLDKDKIKETIEKGLRLQQEIADLREDLKAMVTEAAQLVNVKPAILNKAIRVAFKSSLSKQREDIETLEEILEAAGRG